MKRFPVFVLVGMVMGGCSGERPTSIGLQGGKLARCPESPNCVSSYDEEDADHRMDPIRFEGSERDALARLYQVIRGMPRVKIVESVALEGSPLFYVAAEFSSRILGFVDDVEFVVDGETKTIHFRSASRLGHSDLGVNRARMEEISREFSKKR